MNRTQRRAFAKEKVAREGLPGDKTVSARKILADGLKEAWEVAVAETEADAEEVEVQPGVGRRQSGLLVAHGALGKQKKRP